MALKTFGTTANNSLQAFVVGPDDVVPAQIALLNGLVKRDMWAYGGGMGPLGTARQRIPVTYMRKGRIFIPQRGELVLREGDYIAIDATTGWPIVISADAVANGPYVHS
jgi:hypothetical protein